MTIIAEQTVRGKATGAAKWGVSDKGNDQLNVEYKILDGDDEGRSITKQFYFTDAAMDKSIEALRYSGCTFPDDNITDLTGLGSAEVRLVIEHEKYDGKTRAKLAWVNASMFAPKNEMSDPEKRSFAQRMKAHVSAAKKGESSGMRRPAGSSDPAPIDDSDIPF